MPSPKLVNFLDLNSAVLVDQLDRPSIRPLLSHLFRRCPDLSDHFRRPSAATNRDLAISLLDLLRREGGQPILMVFLWALLQSGHLLLFCRFIQLHLVDSLRFEQFAKTTDGGAGVAPLRHDLELPKFEDAIDSSSSTDLAAHRREFVERHAEMVRMKLGEAERIREMMEEWGTIPGMVTENGEGGGENGVAAGCEPLIALLLAQNQPHRAFDSFCLALLTSRQFRMFSIFHELADLKWLDQCWRHLVENAEDGGENGEEEDESEEEEEEEGLPSMLKGVLEDLRVETVDSAGNNGKFDFLAYYRAHKNDIYPNFSSPRGLALIINNYRFQGRAQREGSQVDATNISNLLQQLDYKVLLKNDMTAEQIRWAMAEFASLPDHQHLDSAIVVLMSHGEFEVILGTDDRPVDVHELIGLVNQNALGLRGKPKIFIVQACRGGGRKKGGTQPTPNK